MFSKHTVLHLLYFSCCFLHWTFKKKKRVYCSSVIIFEVGIHMYFCYIWCWIKKSNLIHVWAVIFFISIQYSVKTLIRAMCRSREGGSKLPLGNSHLRNSFHYKSEKKASDPSPRPSTDRIVPRIQPPFPRKLFLEACRNVYSGLHFFLLKSKMNF